MTSSSIASGRNNLLAATIGNVLEWYDFAVYGFLAAIIGKRFFPADDPLASLLASFGVFAIGFLARPLGGFLFGHIGDRFGRKPALLFSLGLMGAGTFAIGVLPDVSQIGDATAVMLVLLRVLQGLSMGGEYTGSAVYLAENAPQDRRGFIASWSQVGCLAGVLLGSGCAALTSNVIGEAEMQAWGWRIPFLFGALIALWGVIVRRYMIESPVLKDEKKSFRFAGAFGVTGSLAVGVAPGLPASGNQHWILHAVCLCRVLSYRRHAYFDFKGA